MNCELLFHVNKYKYVDAQRYKYENVWDRWVVPIDFFVVILG